MNDPNPVPPKPDPKDRPALCEYAYNVLGARLLEWQTEFGLTSAEYAGLLARATLQYLAAVVASERAGGPPTRGLADPAQ